MVPQLMYVLVEEQFCGYDTDEQVIKLRNSTFVNLEKKRHQKDKNQKIIDLPFGLWQCKCGFVNKIIVWPKCVNCS